MTGTPEPIFDPRLLDLHLGALESSQAAELRARIHTDANLKSQDEALSVIFAALRRASVPPPRAGLEGRIQAAVAALPRAPRVFQPAAVGAANAETWIIRFAHLREIVAVAAMIVLVVGLGIPGLLHVRERSQRIGCSFNLARVGQGLAAYANAFSSSLPFAGWDRNWSWQPSNEPGVQTRPNRRHVYPLVRDGNVQAAWLVCPSRADVPMPADQIGARDDFLESRNVSYAYQNMAGVRPSLSDHPDTPILADDNPLFDNGLPLLGVAGKLGLAQPGSINSRAHGGAGQNVLTIRGEVKWATTPNAGVNGDNIWTLSGVREYTGHEGPSSATDAHLLK